MRFRPLSSRTVRWRSVENEGLEHLTLEARSDGTVEARAAVIGAFEGAVYGACYRILCDAGWRVTEFEVRNTAGRSVAMRSPGPGRWQDVDGRARPEFDGCIDIDLSATPFTNTLPIRRLALSAAAGRTTLRMLFVPFDTLLPFGAEQHYTAIEDGRLYRYENADGSFAADLPLDEDGLVLDYPEMFRRA